MAHASHISEALKPVCLPDPPDDALQFSSEDEAIPEVSALQQPRAFVSKFRSSGAHDNSHNSVSPEPTTAITPMVENLSVDCFLQAMSLIAGEQRGRERQCEKQKDKEHQSKSTTPQRNPVPAISNSRQELLQARELAKVRETKRAQRLAAISRLQRWWRRILYFRRVNFLPLFQQRLIHFATAKALMHLSAAMKVAYIHRSSGLLQRYQHSCAVVIQRFWRRAVVRRRRAREQLKALIQGWKTRRILSAWPLLDVKKRLKQAWGADRRLTQVEFAQTFRDEYRCGKWMRKRRVRNMSNSISPLRTKTTHSPSLSTISPPPKTEKQVVKSFLRRKTQKVQMQRLNWASVSTRINCWSEHNSPDTKKSQRKSPLPARKNSLEEFIEMEKLSLQLAPCPQKRKPLRTQKTVQSLRRLKFEKPSGEIPVWEEEEASELALCSTFDSSQGHRIGTKFEKDLFSTSGGRGSPDLDSL